MPIEEVNPDQNKSCFESWLGEGEKPKPLPTACSQEPTVRHRLFFGADVILDQTMHDFMQGNLGLTHTLVGGDFGRSPILQLFDSLTEDVAEQKMASNNIYAARNQFGKLHR